MNSINFLFIFIDIFYTKVKGKKMKNRYYKQKLFFAKRRHNEWTTSFRTQKYFDNEEVNKSDKCSEMISNIILI